MNEERDFAIDDLDLERTPDLPADPPTALDPAPAPAQDPAPAPRVVIEYRSRGLHSALLPPLVLVAVVLAITIPYRWQSRLRPPAPPTTAPKPAAPASGKGSHSTPGRIIFVEAEGTGAAVEPIAVRSMNAPPALPPTPPLAPLPAPTEEVPDAATAANAEAAPEAVAGATASATPAATEPAPLLARTGSQANPGPFAPLSPDPAAGAPPEAPVQPALEPPAPLTSAQGRPLSPDSPELAFRPAAAVLAAMAPEPAAPEPKLTKEMIEKNIAAEAQQKKAEQKNLEREVAESRLREFLDMIQQANAQRAPFHEELLQILRQLGNEAGPQIDDLCDRYGRKDVHPDVKKMVIHALNRGGSMLKTDAKIRMMRSRGLPEPVILDVLSNELDKLIRNTRGGPRTLEGVRVRAAWLLLKYPPPPIPPEKPADAAPQPNATATAVRAPAAP